MIGKRSNVRPRAAASSASANSTRRVEGSIQSRSIHGASSMGPPELLGSIPLRLPGFAWPELQVGEETFSPFSLPPFKAHVAPMKITFGSKTTLLVSSAVLLLPEWAQAHPGHGIEGFRAGFAHPLMGVDHLVAMIAVGLWAAQLGGRARWMVPLSFLVTMMAGVGLGAAHFPLPMVEAGILASVLTLGLLTSMAVRTPLWASMAIAGAFALFHGHAHGLEMSASAGSLTGVGFLAATALLQGLAIGAGSLVVQAARIRALRWAGAAIV